MIISALVIVMCCLIQRKKEDWKKLEQSKIKVQELSALIKEHPKDHLNDQVERELDQEQPTYLKEQASEDILNDEGDIEIEDIEAQAEGKYEMHNENPLSRAGNRKITQSASEVMNRQKSIRDRRKSVMVLSSFSIEENAYPEKK